jgi:hypothetical protein
VEGLGVTCFFGACLLLFLCWTGIVFAARLACLWPTSPKHFLALWLGVPVLGFTVLICLSFAMSFYRSLPSVVFRDSLGFDPPPDVTFVDSLRHMPIDWDDSYLVFYASDVTIEGILQNGFAPIRPSDIDEYGTDPQWWKPPKGPSVRIYATNTDDPVFRNQDFRFFLSHRLLTYDSGLGDPHRRKVYLRYRRP